MRRLGYLFTLAMAIALVATAGFAQDGKLKIKVTPKQAYVFVDGNAIREGNQSDPPQPGQTYCGRGQLWLQNLDARRQHSKRASPRRSK